MTPREKVDVLADRGAAAATLGRSMSDAFGQERSAQADLIRACAEAIPDDAFALAATFVPTAREMRGVRGLCVTPGLWLTTERAWLGSRKGSADQLEGTCPEEMVERGITGGFVADALATLLERHIGGAATRRIEESRATVERLRAVTLLLRGRR